MGPSPFYEDSGHRESVLRILEILRLNRNLDFSGFRTSVIDREVRHRMDACGCPDLQDYARMLDRSPEEADRLLDAMTIGVSEFFRDPHVFSFLSGYVIPSVLENKSRKQDHMVRVWSAGCCRGEEAYSAAILLLEALKLRREPFRLLVFGTDIDEGDLEAAERGRYGADSIAKVPFGLVSRYFDVEDGLYVVTEEPRRVTRFSRHDLLSGGRPAPEESIYGTFDMILCCNVLMYMRPEVQAEVFERIDRALSRGGYLVLGEAESIPAEKRKWYDNNCPHCKVYRKA